MLLGVSRHKSACIFCTVGTIWIVSTLFQWMDWNDNAVEPTKIIERLATRRGKDVLEVIQTF